MRAAPAVVLHFSGFFLLFGFGFLIREVRRCFCGRARTVIAAVMVTGA